MQHGVYIVNIIIHFFARASSDIPKRYIDTRGAGIIAFLSVTYVHTYKLFPICDAELVKALGN